MFLFTLIVNLTVVLFLVGSWGAVVVRGNLLVILMSIELILFAISLQFVAFSAYFDDLLGQITSMIILTIAAAESALGLAILVIHYRLRGSLETNFLITLKT